MTDIPKWFEYAKTYRWVTEVKGPNHNSYILKMWERIRQKFNDDETPWCAAFVGNCLERAGIVSTRSGLALSYEKWGQPAFPTLGAIAYMKRYNSAGKLIGGHVAFVAGRTPKGNVALFGGNQGDRVSIAIYPASRIMGYRWPKGVALPPRAVLPLYADSGTLGAKED